MGKYVFDFGLIVKNWRESCDVHHFRLKIEKKTDNHRVIVIRKKCNLRQESRRHVISRTQLFDGETSGTFPPFSHQR